MEQALKEMRAIVFQGRETGKPVVVEPADTDSEITGLGQKIDDLQQAITRLTGQLESAGHDVEDARKEADALREENGALTARVAALEQKVTELATPPPPVAATAPPTTAQPADPAAAMAAARAAFNAGDYAGAEAGFRGVAGASGDTPQGNGGALLHRQDPDRPPGLRRRRLAGPRRGAAVARYAWAPDAALDLSRAMLGMKESREACGVLAEIDSHYPKAGPGVKAVEADVRSEARCAAGLSIGAGWASDVLGRLDRRLNAPDRAPVAVALSGGGNSLALLHLARLWGERAGRRIVALTVDHGLQPQGAAWARLAAERAAGLGIAHRTLFWVGPEARVRPARGGAGGAPRAAGGGRQRARRPGRADGPHGRRCPGVHRYAPPRRRRADSSGMGAVAGLARGARRLPAEATAGRPPRRAEGDARRDRRNLDRGSGQRRPALRPNPRSAPARRSARDPPVSGVRVVDQTGALRGDRGRRGRAGGAAPASARRSWRTGVWPR